MVQERTDRDIVYPSPPPGKIFNPVTGKYYEIREHSGKYNGPGQIKGLWSYEKKSPDLERDFPSE
jgi:hypothetical protein